MAFSSSRAASWGLDIARERGPPRDGLSPKLRMGSECVRWIGEGKRGGGVGQARKEPDQDGRSWSGPTGARPGDGRMEGCKWKASFFSSSHTTRCRLKPISICEKEWERERGMCKRDGASLLLFRILLLLLLLLLRLLQLRRFTGDLLREVLA